MPPGGSVGGSEYKLGLARRKVRAWTLTLVSFSTREKGMDLQRKNG